MSSRGSLGQDHGLYGTFERIEQLAIARLLSYPLCEDGLTSG